MVNLSAKFDEEAHNSLVSIVFNKVQAWWTDGTTATVLYPLTGIINHTTVYRYNYIYTDHVINSLTATFLEICSLCPEFIISIAKLCITLQKMDQYTHVCYFPNPNNYIAFVCHNVYIELNKYNLN